MPTLIYIHGFLSSPYSYKAQQTQAWLKENRPDWQYLCPALNPYPNEIVDTLTRCIEKALDAAEPVYLMGSSMGGFWATYLSNQYGLKSVIINPAVDVLDLMPKYLDQELKNYHTEETYRLDNTHLQQLNRYLVSHIKTPKNLWLLAQTDDEVLDYRLAEVKYQGCRQTIEAGGDHGFQKFERFIPQTIDFFEAHT